MKLKYFILFIVLIVCSVTFAQNLSIKEFSEVANDLSARTQPRLDANGVGCALVKVRLASDGATFRGMTVGNIKSEPGEYWVYMGVGAKKLTVMLSGYLPLDVIFADYNISKLESKSVYVLTLNLQSFNHSSRLRPLVLNVEPKNAYVTIDNLQFIPNDGTIRVPLSVGTHDYSIEASNYTAQKGQLLLEDEETDKIVSFKLVPNINGVETNEDIGYTAMYKRIENLIVDWKLKDALSLVNYLQEQNNDRDKNIIKGIAQLKYKMNRKVDEGKPLLIKNIKDNKGKLNQEGKVLLEELLAVAPNDYWLNIIKNK